MGARFRQLELFWSFHYVCRQCGYHDWEERMTADAFNYTGRGWSDLRVSRVIWDFQETELEGLCSLCSERGDNER